MAMFHYNLDTFAEVERRYDRVKPIRTTGQVPLGDRARKWEHIIKVNKNKYVLMDKIPDDEGNRFWCGSTKEEIARAPVTWTRCAHTGIEKIRVRNDYGDTCHNQRYSFLVRALPSCMDFLVQQGKQYVILGDTHHYLPKSTWVNSHMYKSLVSMRASHGETAWNTQKMTKTDDGKYLDFERDSFSSRQQWTCTTARHKQPVTRTKISGEKKKYYGVIREYAEWAWVMQSILMNRDHYDWEHQRLIRQQCGDAITDSDVFRDMLKDPTDERRSPVAIAILGEISEYDWQTQTSSPPEDEKKFMSKFKSQVDKLANFKIKYQDYK